MLSLRGVDRKKYEAWSRGPFPDDLPCPCCPTGCLRPHGGYFRYVDNRLSRIRRGWCPPCGVTHAILPEDVCAYRDLSLDELASVLTAPGPTAAARSLGDEDPVTVRRLRRWRREASGPRARHSARVLPTTGSPSSWWERALEGYGDLVAWRHRLWSQAGWFATPLLGLFRRGRPPSRVAENST